MKYLTIIAIVVVVALIIHQGYCPENSSDTWHWGHVLDNNDCCKYCGGRFPL